MKKNICGYQKIFVYLLLCFIMLPVTNALAVIKTGQLSPVRVIMEGRDRSEIVRLINTDSVTNRYRITTVLMKMDDQGKLVEIKKPNPQQEKIREMFRFSPRRVSIEPRGYQNIRIMVRKPADLPTGEYRVHLRAGVLPDKYEETSSEKGLINLDVMVHVSIPIIFRTGQGSVTLTPQSCVLEKDAKSLAVQLQRTGEYSAYFGITAYTLGQDGIKKEIAKRLGLGYYPPTSQRTFHIPLEEPDLANTLSGQNIFLEILNYEKQQNTTKGPWKFLLN